MPGTHFKGPIFVAGVEVIDESGNIDAPVTTTDLTTTGNTTLGNATTDTLAVNGNATFTGTAAGNMVDVVATATTTGIGVDVSGNTALTTGQLLKLGSNATAITTTGRMFLSDHSGATGTSAVLNEFASAATDETTIAKVTASGALAAGVALDISAAAMQTGKAVDISDLDALTTGTAIHVDATGATQTSGKLVHLDSASTALTSAGRLLLSDHTAAATASGAGILNEFKTAAADATTLVKLTSTAAQTGPVLDISAAALATGKVIDISDLDGITTGKAIHVDATGVTQTDGILVHLDSAGTAISSTGRILLSDHTGATTTSGILNEFKSIATDETVIAQVTAGGLLAAGKALNISAATMTTGKGLSMDNLDGLTTGGGISVTSNSADTGTRSLVYAKNDHASATGATPLELAQDSTGACLKTTSAATSTNFFKVATMNGVTLWVGNGTTGQGNLSGTAGDLLLNGGTNKPEYCTGTTNWTALV